MDLDDTAGATARADALPDKILVKDDSYVVRERKGLPAEVEEVLLNADPYTDPFRATLDSLTGFAFLLSRDACFVWNWSRRSSSSTTYIFPLPAPPPLPPTVSVFSPLSFASLVPATSHQSQREPGLLVISTTGDIRFWDNVSMALSGVDRWKSASAGIVDGELVRGLTMITPSSYLVSTSQSRLLSIAITSTGGRAELSVRPYERALGWAGSVWSAVFGSKAADPRAGILAVAVSEAMVDEERVLYAFTEKSVQVWRIPAREEGGERLAVEQDLFAGVLEALAGEKVGNEEWAQNLGNVEVVDAKLTSTGTLAVLISHATERTAPNALSYAIVLLDVGTTPYSVTVAGVQHLAYQAHPDPRPLSSPKLALTDEDTAFIIFVDAVTMVTLGADAALDEYFPLRSNTSRFLGISTPTSSSPTSRSLTLLASTASLISIDVTPPQHSFNDLPGSEAYKTRKLKSKIEQAIFYGAPDEDNPLAFDLLPDFQGDLIAAAQAVSSELLSSSSANMPSILDLRVQLADRVGRVKGLIGYIGANGLLGKLSQSARRQLSWDAEKLAGAVALWHYQNARLGNEGSLLAEAITRYMAEIGEGFSEDPVRLFFRTRVSHLGGALEQVTKMARARINGGDTQSSTAVLYQANQIITIVLAAVTRHRTESSSLYALDPNVLPLEAWTSRPGSLEGLQWHFDATDALLRERERDVGGVMEDESASYSGSMVVRGGVVDESNPKAVHGEMKKQMAQLAEFLFAAFQERLLFLRSVNTETGTSAETRVVTDRYVNLRPRFIRTLVSIGKVTHAYELAERFGDFHSLVELCNDPTHGSVPRTRFFLQKYGDAFAFELYQFYIEKGQLRVLLEPEEAYQPLLTKFLDMTDLYRISWINDISIGRFEQASEALVSEASIEQNLAQKKLMLSLGKLSKVAQADKEILATEDFQRSLEVIDDNLDMISAQQGLHDFVTKSLSIVDLQLPLEQQAEVVASRVAPLLARRHPAFSQFYIRSCKGLLEGEVLSPEDLIDLLTLKEDDAEPGVTFSEALEILVRAKNLPEARRQVALQTIWRRIYIRDDWAGFRAASELKDEELSAALRSTALYETLTKAADANHPNTMFLQPSEALFTGSADELSARFPDAPAHLVSLWLNNYEAENQELEEALGRHGLEAYCGEIERLFREGEPGLGMDDSMAE